MADSPSKDSKTEQPDNQDLLQDLKDKFQLCWDYVENNYHADWDDYWAVYNSRRTDKRSYDGITDTFDPITFSTIETLVAGLASGEPKWNFVPTVEDQSDETEVLNALIDNYWEADQWETKTMAWIKDHLIYGTGVIFVYWDIDRPRILNIPVRDFIFDPASTNPDNARYMGRRFLTTKEHLQEAEAVNPETGELEKLYKNIDQLEEGEGGKTGEDLDKEHKEMFTGSTYGDKAYKEQIECIEIWTPDRVYTMANRRVIIRDEENPYKTQSVKRSEENPIGILPFVVQRNYPDPSSMLGTSEIQAILKFQELTNDVTNQNVDAVTKTLQPMAEMPDEHREYIDEINIVPDGILPFEGFKYIQPPNVPAGGFSLIAGFKDAIRETTSSNEIVKGAGQTGGKVTATEANLQVSQSNARFNVKLRQLEKDGFHRLAKLTFRMVQLFVDADVWVRVARSQGVEFDKFTPEQFIGEYEPRVQLSVTQNNEKLNQQSEALQLYELLQVNPTVNQDALNKILLPKIGDVLSQEEVTQIFTQPEQPLGLEGAPVDPQLQDPLDPTLIPQGF